MSWKDFDLTKWQEENNKFDHEEYNRKIEELKETATTLDEYFQGLIKIKSPPWKPCAFYNKDGDIIEVLLDTKDYYAHWVNPQITVLLAFDTNEIVGVEIWGAKRLFREDNDDYSPTEINHGNDNDNQVFFYEHDFYVLSNFSSFSIEWKGKLWPTSEHAYQSEKFDDPELKEQIRTARSAHEAYKLAQSNEHQQRADWDNVKLDVMLYILRAKTEQHEYVKRKLLATGDKELIEDSWRDNFWGWGEHKDGQNHLGKLWMQLRKEIRQKEQK